MVNSHAVSMAAHSWFLYVSQQHHLDPITKVKDPSLPLRCPPLSPALRDSPRPTGPAAHGPAVAITSFCPTPPPAPWGPWAQHPTRCLRCPHGDFQPPGPRLQWASPHTSPDFSLAGCQRDLWVLSPRRLQDITVSYSPRLPATVHTVRSRASLSIDPFTHSSFICTFIHSFIQHRLAETD